MKDSLRLFIGFSVTVDNGLRAVMKKLRMNADQKKMEVKWVPESNLHVTTHFLGETPGEQVPTIKALLQQESEHLAPFTTSLQGMGAYPDERHARVLWVGVRNSRGLTALQASLLHTLTTHGFAIENRVYSPHLTLGRLRKSRTATDLLSPFVRTRFHQLPVSQIVLFESRLHGAHPVYHPLATFTLSGSSDVKADESPGPQHHQETE